MARKRRRRRTIRMDHHIYYGPDWTVELTFSQHRAVSNLQHMNGFGPKGEINYSGAVNFQTAVNHEVNRIRAELDTSQNFKKIFHGKDMFTRKPLKIKRRRDKKNGKDNISRGKEDG
jgi:hypothetical protein